MEMPNGEIAVVLRSNRADTELHFAPRLNYFSVRYYDKKSCPTDSTNIKLSRVNIKDRIKDGALSIYLF